MPKNKFQELVFSALMAFAMSYAMELYNLSLLNGKLENFLFIEVFKDVFFVAAIVIAVERLAGGRLARHLAFNVVDPKKDRPFLVTLTVQFFTVSVMSPIMSLIATIMFKHPGSEILAVWLQTLAFNLPMAFFWQIFFAGPLVRFVFRTIFKASNQNLKTSES